MNSMSSPSTAQTSSDTGSLIGNRFVSYAPNHEDVVLHRALVDVDDGHYIEVTTCDPVHRSVTRAFYERGWRGISVQQVPIFAETHRAVRPGDQVLDAGTRLPGSDDAPGGSLGVIIDDGPLADADIHFLLIDAWGKQPEVFTGLDLVVHRPWIIVVTAARSATEPLDIDSWDGTLTEANYRFCFFDGKSRFYVAAERDDELATALTYPACPHDQFIGTDNLEAERLGRDVAEMRAVTEQLDQRLTDFERSAEHALARAQQSADRATESSNYWSIEAVDTWARSAGGITGLVAGADQAEIDHLRRQNHLLVMEQQALERTVSWRVTKPLRLVRRAVRPLGAIRRLVRGGGER